MNGLKEVEKGVEWGPTVPRQGPRLRQAHDPVLGLAEADLQAVAAEVAGPGDFVDDPAFGAVHLDSLVVAPPQADAAGVQPRLPQRQIRVDRLPRRPCRPAPCSAIGRSGVNVQRSQRTRRIGPRSQ